MLAGAATLAAGSGIAAERPVAGPSMAGFAVPAMERVRIAFIGVGERGSAAVKRVSRIPGCVVEAICDLRKEAVDSNQKWLKENRRDNVAKRFYSGTSECWKGACDDSGVDLVYVAVPAYLHARIAVYAMNAGKHVLVEVPAANTLDDCWNIVETSERTRRHCMMLENCCYGEYEMLALNMIRMGLFGEIVHGEAGYIHDQRGLGHMMPPDDPTKTRVIGGKVVPAVGPTGAMLGSYGRHHGNWYPTHGLGPVARCMNINHGDRFDYLVSLESKQASLEAYGKGRFPKDSWQANWKVVKGDMNQSLIRTVMGKSILLQHDVMSPRP